ncbi:hypothetical protein JHW43_007468 [Diplocarpon mali]|nr:hypothetical protein JHW43_007468 [Diplocarpon mali]
MKAKEVDAEAFHNAGWPGHLILFAALLYRIVAARHREVEVGQIGSGGERFALALSSPSPLLSSPVQFTSPPPFTPHLHPSPPPLTFILHPSPFTPLRELPILRINQGRRFAPTVKRSRDPGRLDSAEHGPSTGPTGSAQTFLAPSSWLPNAPSAPLGAENDGIRSREQCGQHAEWAQRLDRLGGERLFRSHETATEDDDGDAEEQKTGESHHIRSDQIRSIRPSIHLSIQPSVQPITAGPGPLTHSRRLHHAGTDHTVYTAYRESAVSTGGYMQGDSPGVRRDALSDGDEVCRYSQPTTLDTMASRLDAGACVPTPPPRPMEIYEVKSQFPPPLDPITLGDSPILKHTSATYANSGTRSETHGYECLRTLDLRPVLERDASVSSCAVERERSS